jgi:hypothetical protein
MSPFTTPVTLVEALVPDPMDEPEFDDMIGALVLTFVQEVAPHTAMSPAPVPPANVATILFVPVGGFTNHQSSTWAVPLGGVPLSPKILVLVVDVNATPLSVIEATVRLSVGGLMRERTEMPTTSTRLAPEPTVSAQEQLPFVVPLSFVVVDELSNATAPAGGVGVFVGVNVGVIVAVFVGVFVGVNVFVGVGVMVGVLVFVGVSVAVDVGAAPEAWQSWDCGMICFAWLELDHDSIATAPPVFS